MLLVRDIVDHMSQEISVQVLQGLLQNLRLKYFQDNVGRRSLKFLIQLQLRLYRFERILTFLSLLDSFSAELSFSNLSVIPVVLSFC